MLNFHSKQALAAVLLLLLSLVLLACGSKTTPLPSSSTASIQEADTTTSNTAGTPPKVGASVGLTAPQLTGTDINGSKLQLSDFRGKAVVVNFFTTW